MHPFPLSGKPHTHSTIENLHSQYVNSGCFSLCLLDSTYSSTYGSKHLWPSNFHFVRKDLLLISQVQSKY